MTTYSLYDITVPAFQRQLAGLSWVLCKADQYYREQGKDTAQLMTDSLAPDMFNLGMQVMMVLQHSIGAVERTLGQPDRIPLAPLATLADARAAVVDAQARLKLITPEQIDASLDRQLKWDPRGTGGMSFDGAKAYLVDFVTPNFWFHTTTCYAIVRKNGVPIGKGDFMARGEAPEGLAA